MKVEFGEGWVRHNSGILPVSYPVLDARHIGNVIVVLYDYMAFPREQPARNLFAYDLNGTVLWRARDIGMGATDAYTNIRSEQPLVVGNFAGFVCTIDPGTGQVVDSMFTK